MELKSDVYRHPRGRGSSVGKGGLVFPLLDGLDRGLAKLCRPAHSLRAGNFSGLAHIGLDDDYAPDVRRLGDFRIDGSRNGNLLRLA